MKNVPRATSCLCGAPRRRSGHDCLSCHNAWMRANRPRHRDLPTVARKKANARSYAKVYQRRGLLKPEPCRDCGSEMAEKHHPDYSRPLFVIWLCRKCHLAVHPTT